MKAELEVDELAEDADASFFLESVLILEIAVLVFVWAREITSIGQVQARIPSMMAFILLPAPLFDLVRWTHRGLI